MSFQTLRFSLVIKLSIICFFSFNNTFAQRTATYNILKYGAVADGKKLNTVAIQKVIDLASKKGGGKVIIPEGRFLTGSLELKNNVDLHLEKNAVLLGSIIPADYHKIEMPGMPETPKKDDLPQMALIAAHKAVNISITGEGTIDGQGTALALNIDSLHHIGQVVDPHYNTNLNRPNERMRPKLIGIAECTNVTFKEATFMNPACWGLNFELCTNLVIDGIKVNNRAFWNNDGMDITDCRNVKVTNCDVNSADDGICLKSYYPGHFDDSVYVANCKIVSGASAVKFGTASYGGFKNITIENLDIKDTYRSAIAIESVDGGTIDNVKVEHIRAKNTGNAIFIRLGHRAGNTAGGVKNIYLHDIKVDIPFIRPDNDYDLRADEPGYHNPFPSSITGIPGYAVQNVTLDDVEITCPGRATKAQSYFGLYRLDQLPEKIKEYPEFSMFGELPAWALLVRHAQGITLKNIKLNLKDDDYRPALIFHDVKGLQVSDVSFPVKATAPQLVMKDVTGQQINSALEKSTIVIK